MNMSQAINNALDCALAISPRTLLFGEDIEFGGVFRCSVGLRSKYGRDRVFNTPSVEQGIVGFAIGLGSNGWRPVAEIQFADFIYPAFDQLINEASKYRYRSGGSFNCGGLTVRSPYGAMGHGGMYHSQSPEGFLTHVPGLKIVIPSNPSEAKGLLLACIFDENPCVFLEPKSLYHHPISLVKEEAFEIPLGKARVVRKGKHVTVITYGAQLQHVIDAVKLLSKRSPKLDAEIIDLRTLLPCDFETLIRSVKHTGRFVITHEAPKTSGFGAELVATLTEECFFSLEAPPKRVCGYDSPVPHIHEGVYVPDAKRICNAILSVCEF